MAWALATLLSALTIGLAPAVARAQPTVIAVEPGEVVEDSPIALDARDGAVEVINRGTVRSELDATGDGVAIGIATGDEDDSVRNEGSVSADVEASQQSPPGEGVEASAIASGVTTADGGDVVDNDSTLDASASAAATSSPGLVDDDAVLGPQTAAAEATGVDSGADDDTLDGSGTTSVSATAQASSGALDGDLQDDALGDTSTNATTAARGLAAGSGADEVDGDQDVEVEARSDAVGAAVSVTISGSIRGDASGEALSDASADARARATAIEAGFGNDVVTDSGDLSVEAESTARMTGVGVAVVVTPEGDVSDAAISDASASSEARAAGIEAGYGADRIERSGDIEIGARSDATSLAVSVALEGTADGDTSGAALGDSSATSWAEALGIDGGAGNDQIGTETGDRVLADADATARSVAVVLEVSGTSEGNGSGAALSDASATADAWATGIHGGFGRDTIENRADIVADGRSDATTVDVAVQGAVSVDGAVEGRALNDSSADARSSVTGIAGGWGGDTIENRGAIALMLGDEVDASATSVAVAVEIAGSVEGDASGAALSDASARSQAQATGIDAGEFSDEVENRGAIAGGVDARATGVDVAVGVVVGAGGTVQGAALSDASATADAAFTGIAGGGGSDTLRSESQPIAADVSAGATSVAVGVQIAGTAKGSAEGAALSDASSLAAARATGLDGGDGGDTIDNDSAISADAVADADAVAVGASVALDVASGGEVTGAALSDASATAQSTVTGIDGGTGGDTITNDGRIDLMRADAVDADALGVAVSLTVAGSVKRGDENGDGDSEGAAVSDSSATAEASGTGIAAGAGVDEITNRAFVAGDVAAKAKGGSGSLVVAGAVNGDDGGEISGAALSDASAAARSAATGIDGGDDGDRVENDGAIDLAAQAESTGVAVSLTVAGTVTGGDDEMQEQGSVASAEEDEDGGRVYAAAVSDASSTADARTTGLDGGDGADAIENDAGIAVDARADADAVSVGAGVALVVEGGAEVDAVTLSDASAAARATAIGIEGGTGGDTIDNDGAIHVMRENAVDAEALGVAVALTVSGTVKGDASGAVSGAALSDTRADAEATAAGIAAGDDSDTIINRAGITAEVGSKATAGAGSLTVTGQVGDDPGGDVSGFALGVASADARARASGIDAGDADDTIDHDGEVFLVSTAHADGVAVGVSVAGSVKTQKKQDDESEPTFALAQSESDQDDGVVGGALSDASANARAGSAGIQGGAGSDEIESDGSIAAISTATADGVAVGVGAQAKVGEAGDVSGFALGDASTAADAAATGLDGGEGDDAITSESTLVLQSDATSNSQAVSVEIAGQLARKGIGSGDVEASAVSDARSDARAATLGVGGGEGTDELESRGDLASAFSTATANADAVAVSGQFTLTTKGASNVDLAGAALSDASARAEATSTALDGGAGDDTVRNEGRLGFLSTLASSTSDAVSVELAGSVTSKGASAGDVAASALSNASSTAEATTVGLSGGTGSDALDNRGDATSVRAEAQSESDAVAVGVAFAVTSKGGSLTDVEGAAVSDAAARASSQATFLDGGEGDDEVDNEGDATTIESVAGAESDAVSVELAGSVTSKGAAGGDVAGMALSDASASADARARGLSGGEGGDRLYNRGRLEQISATSISEADAVSVAAQLSVTSQGASLVDVEGVSVSDASAHARASATALDGGEGHDELMNAGALPLITSYAQSDSDAVSVEIAGNITSKGASAGNISGFAVSDASSTAQASTLGLDGGAGADTLENRADLGSLSAVAFSDADATSVGATFALTTKGGSLVDVEGAALSNASSVADASTTAFASGEGDDTLLNEGDLDSATSYARSTSDAVAVELAGNVTFKGASFGEVGATAASDASSTALAATTGLDAGDGDDTLTNRGNLTGLGATATSDSDSFSAAFAVSVPIKGLSVVDVEGAALSDSSATSEARTTGLDAGAGNDDVTSEGDVIAVASTADASSLAISIAIAGTVLADATNQALSEAGADADARTTGIAAGSGNDELENYASVIATSGASAGSTSVSVGATVSIGAGGEASGAALSDSSATADATATGLDAGEGEDIVENDGALTALAVSDAESTVVAVQIGVGSGGVFGGGAESEAASNAGSEAESRARGIDGGAGDDTLTNRAAIASDARADASSTSVSAAISVQVGSFGESTGASLSDSSATALAEASGIDAGAGDDVVTNEGAISLMQGNPTEQPFDATADAFALGLGIAVGGTASDTSARALTDASTHAQATGTGILGGLGEDTLDNRGRITSDVGASAEATAVSGSLGISLGAGSQTEAAALGDSSATGIATTMGLDGGAGEDDIDNAADIGLLAASRASAKAITVTLGVAPAGVVTTDSMADSSAQAMSLAEGIGGGGGDDEIDTTEQSINATALSFANAESISISGTASIGVADGGGLSDSSATAMSSARGIGGDALFADEDSGSDEITNASAIDVSSLASAEADSTTVAVGVTVGAAGAANLGDASANAIADATGIDGGAADDEIVNTGSITAGAVLDPLGMVVGPMARADSEATTVDVSLGVGFANREAGANSSATADARTAGIRGGDGDDFIENRGTISLAGGPENLQSLAVAQSTSSTVKVGIQVGASLGSAASDAAAEARAEAVGLAGGEGSDEIENFASITIGTDPEPINLGNCSTTLALACAQAGSESTDVSITIGGSEGTASSDSSSTARADVAGIDGGASDDRIHNEGDIEANATSEAYASSGTSTFGVTLGVSSQEASASSAGLSSANADGIDGGEGADVIDSMGAIRAVADAESNAVSDATNVSIIALGASDQSAFSDTSSTAAAVAHGIDGGDGDQRDEITHVGSLDVESRAKVLGAARSSTVQGFGVGFTSQESQASAASAALASASGIRSGDGGDVVTSDAAITVDADSRADAATRSVSNTGFTLAGGAEGDSFADASSAMAADATGIEGNGGDDEITSKGTIEVTAESTGTARSTSIFQNLFTLFGGVSGSAASNASARLETEATGIDGGAGDDTIRSEAPILATASSDGIVDSSAGAKASVAFGSASTKTAADGSAVADAESAGIAGGEGNDTIASQTSLESHADASLDVKVASVSVSNSTFGSAYAASAADSRTETRARASGIDGGTGDDTIDTEGTLDATAEANTQVVQVSAAFANATFGPETTVANSNAVAGSHAEATGIDAGDGDDEVTSRSTITVDADGLIDVKTLTVSSDGDATSDARTRAGARARGIDGGEGNDEITNMGVTQVAAAQQVAVGARTFGGGGRVSGQIATELDVEATGIAGGPGDDTVMNQGEVQVRAGHEEGSAPDVAVVEVTVGRNVTIDASTRTQTSAAGIDGGAGVDRIENMGNVDVESRNSTFVGTRDIGQEVTAEVSTRSDVGAVGISAGAGGGKIESEGAIEVDADSLVTADGSVVETGFAFFRFDDEQNVDISGRSAAAARGIEGGSGVESVMNRSTLLVRSASEVVSQSKVTADVGSESVISFAAASDSIGVDTAGGADRVKNAESGLIQVEARATGDVQGVTLPTQTFLPSAPPQTNSSVAISGISASSRGIDIGGEASGALNEGQLVVRSNAESDAVAIAEQDFFFLGLPEENGRAVSEATAQARGICSGAALTGSSCRPLAGGGVVVNRAGIDVMATANAFSFGKSGELDENDLGAVTDGGEEGERTFVDADRIGEQNIVGKNIRFETGGSAGFESVVEAFDSLTGTFTLRDAFTMDLAEDDVYLISFAKEGRAGAFVRAEAVGLELGGADVMVLNGRAAEIRVNAEAEARAQAAAVGIVNVARGEAEGESDARGIVTGTGNDMLMNLGSIDVEAETRVEASSGGLIIVGDGSDGRAEAVGIDSGDGNDTVVHTGSIDVEARLADGNLPPGTVGANTFATGIRTGPGDDHVVSGGQIAVLADQMTGIDTGTGADRVELLGDSQLGGGINLGADDDELTLADAAQVQGVVRSGAGSDAVRIVDRNRFELDALEENEHYQVDQGVLQVMSETEIPSDGGLRAEIYNGGFGQMLVEGAAPIAGTVEAMVSPRAFMDGDAFALLSAQSIQGRFDQVMLPVDSALVRFDSRYTDTPERDLFEVVVAVDPYSTVATERLQRVTAEYLEQITPSATGDLSELLGHFQLMPAGADFDTAFASLSPEQYDAATLAGIDSQRHYLRSIERRLDSIRALRILDIDPQALGSFELATSRSAAGILALARALPGQTTQSSQQPGASRTWVWVDALGQFGDQQRNSGFSGFNYSMGGGAVGVDRLFGERFVGGLNAGYSYTGLDIDKGRGDGDINAGHVSLYGTLFGERSYVDGVFSYARQAYDNTRRVVVDDLSRTAKSDHGANVFGARLSAGHRFDLEGFGIRPFASLSWLMLDEEGFTEEGALSANLAVKSRTTHSLVSELGVRVARAYQPELGTFVPYVTAAWKYDYDVDDRRIVSGLSGAPGTSFTLDGRSLDQHGALTGAGILFLREGWSASLEYLGEFRGDYHANGIFARVGIAF